MLIAAILRGPGLEEAGQAPRGMIVGISVAAVGNAERDFLRPGEVHEQLVHFLRQHDRAFRLLLAVHEHLELNAASRAQVVQTDGGLEDREVLAAHAEHDVGRRRVVAVSNRIRASSSVVSRIWRRSCDRPTFLPRHFASAIPVLVPPRPNVT